MSCGGSSRGFLVTPQAHLKTPGTNPIVQGESISRHIENEHAYETISVMKCTIAFHHYIFHERTVHHTHLVQDHVSIEAVPLW